MKLLGHYDTNYNSAKIELIRSTQQKFDGYIESIEYVLNIILH
jgi:hypothetical protein